MPFRCLNKEEITQKHICQTYGIFLAANLLCQDLLQL